MQRFSISIDDDDLLEVVNSFIEATGYASRAEAIRDMIHVAATQQAALAEQTPCAAVLDYVYDHETHALAQRLTRTATIMISSAFSLT